MVQDTTDDPPQEGGQDDAPLATAEQPGPDPAPAPSRRARRKEIRKEAEERLGKWSFLTAHGPGDPIRVVVAGDQIGSDSGDATAIGTMILRAANFLSSLGANPQLTSLAFGQSVVIEFRAPDAEARRAEEKLEAARTMREEAGDEPSPEQVDAIDLSLRAAVTDVYVAAEMASDLLSFRSTEAPEAAVSYGSDVAETYRTLANAVAKAQVTLTLEGPEEQVDLTPSKALRVSEALRASSEPRERTIIAIGTLSIANQEQHGFGLKLDPDVRKDVLLKGKRVVHGTYLPQVEALIRDQGLWGREVRATLRVVRDALVSTSTIRPAQYTLTDVEPRHRD